jgi:hypothetical protein
MNNRVVPIPCPGPPTSPPEQGDSSRVERHGCESRDGEAGAGAPRALDTMASHPARATERRVHFAGSDQMKRCSDPCAHSSRHGRWNWPH